MDWPSARARVTEATRSFPNCPRGTSTRTGTWLRSYFPASTVNSNDPDSPNAGAAAARLTAMHTKAVLFIGSFFQLTGLLDLSGTQTGTADLPGPQHPVRHLE